MYRGRGYRKTEKRRRYVYTYVKGRGGEGKVWKQANQKVLMGSSVRGVFSSHPCLSVRLPSRAKRGPLRWRRGGLGGGCRADWCCCAQRRQRRRSTVGGGGLGVGKKTSPSVAQPCLGCTGARGRGKGKGRGGGGGGGGGASSKTRPGQTRSYKELFPDGLGGEGLGVFDGWGGRGDTHKRNVQRRRRQRLKTGTGAQTGRGRGGVKVVGVRGSSKILGLEITHPPIRSAVRLLLTPPTAISYPPCVYRRRRPPSLVPPSVPSALLPLLPPPTTYPKSNLAFTRQRNFITALTTLEVRTQSPANLII